ncbi:MAG: hypothetical protein HY860_00775 [Chlamydiales bacterium]|nr:hypothetical protein [Chlamydiales bacterium]
MLEALKPILEIQELDIKMIRLIRLKHQRQKELTQLHQLTEELRQQLIAKEKDLTDMTAQSDREEEKISLFEKKIKELEHKQSNIKKIDEFNAVTQEITMSEREKKNLENKVSNLVDERMAEEEILQKIKDSLATSEQSGKGLEQEILASIKQINEEGQELKQQRDALAVHADLPILKVYERLLKNKKDRVVVPIENRTCSGCHIALTAQHENLVRKGENLVFCEHCSRIHFWQESESLEGTSVATKRRRRRAAVS